MVNMQAILALSPLGLALTACLALWFLSWARYRYPATVPLPAPLAVMIACCKFVLIAIVVVLFPMSLLSAPIFCVVVVIVVISAVVRFRRNETRYLIWNLAEAAQRCIPLETVARAFANERHGKLANRARNLADYLDAAMPLSLALARSRLSFSPDIRLAADIGEKTGTLSASLKKALQQMDDFDHVLGATLARLSYLTVVIFTMLFILTFLMLKIIPTFTEMYTEFGLKLPAVTVLLISVSRFVAAYWYVGLPALVLCFGGGILALLSYLGISLRNWPIVGRFHSTIDNASVLRMLSVAVKEKRPLVGSLELLAAYAPFSRARARLYGAIRQIAEGAHWCDALRSARLVGRSQAGVIKSAERAGNLAWALEEMADSSIRRASLRAQAVLNVMFPALVLLCGIGVMFIAVGVLMPLFDLIAKLS